MKYPRGLRPLLPVLGFFLIAGLTVSLEAGDLGGSVLRDYPVSLTLPKGRFEASLDYQAINKTIDIFDVRKQELSSISGSYSGLSPGDLNGARLMLGYGLLDRTTLIASVQYQDLDYGFDPLKLKTLDLSFKQNLRNVRGGLNVALDAGVRYNTSETLSFDNDAEINAILKRISPSTNVGVRIESDIVWFDRRVGNDVFSIGTRRAGLPDPNVTLADLEDITPYVRITTGWIAGRFFPNFFVEYGHTEIKSEIASTLPLYVPQDLQGRLPRLPIDLSRSEDYLKGGVSLLVKFPYRVLLHLEYDYLKLFRDKGLDFIDYNHIVKADLNYFISPSLVFNIGGVYYHRQLNGIVPFLYNEYTQTTFDHRYGYAHAGLTVLLGGRSGEAKKEKK